MPRKPAQGPTSKPKGEKSKPLGAIAVRGRAINRENADHYTWGRGCEGWHLVKDEQLSVIEEPCRLGQRKCGIITNAHSNSFSFFPANC